ncbi:unnamed protein product [Rhodiola kirilowii]
MDKDKLASHGGGLLPPSGRFPSFSPAGNTFNMSSEASSSTLPPLGPGTAMDSSRFGHGMTSDSGRFSHDISHIGNADYDFERRGLFFLVIWTSPMAAMMC